MRPLSRAFHSTCFSLLVCYICTFAAAQFKAGRIGFICDFFEMARCVMAARLLFALRALRLSVKAVVMSRWNYTDFVTGSKNGI